MSDNLNWILPYVDSRVGGGFDRKWKTRFFSLAFGSVLFFFPFSIVFVVFGILPVEYSWTASVIIALNGVAILASELRGSSSLSALTRCGAIAGSLFLLEYLGVSTGFPFGKYDYTDALGFRVVGVPVAIAFAWYGVVISSWRIAQTMIRSTSNPVLIAILGGMLTVVLDLLLEPMAIRKGYWIWEGGVIPLQNYVSWFLISSATILIMAWREHGVAAGRGHYYTGLVVYGLQALLFAGAGIVSGQVDAALITAITIMLVVYLGRLPALSKERMPDR